MNGVEWMRYFIKIQLKYQIALCGINEIHEITPFNQIRLNWSVSLNWINSLPAHSLNPFTFIPFVEWCVNWIDWTRYPAPFVHYFNSSINFIPCLRFTDWNDLIEWSHSLRLAFCLRHSCFVTPLHFIWFMALHLIVPCIHQFQ